MRAGYDNLGGGMMGVGVNRVKSVQSVCSSGRSVSCADAAQERKKGRWGRAGAQVKWIVLMQFGWDQRSFFSIPNKICLHDFILVQAFTAPVHCATIRWSTCACAVDSYCHRWRSKMQAQEVHTRVSPHTFYMNTYVYTYVFVRIWYNIRMRVYVYNICNNIICNSICIII